VRRNGLRLAATLLTVIPLGRGSGRATGGSPLPAPDRGTAGEAITWAPAVGLLLGLVAAGVLLAADRPLGAGPLTGAALAIAALALLSRGLHLDGLADLADGLGSGKPADAALDIMRKSDIGPLGVVTLVFTVLIQVAALAHATQAGGPARGASAVIAAVVTGRLAMTWACRRGVPAARPDGLGALVAATVRPGVAVAETVVVLAAAVAAVLSWGAITWTLPVGVVAGIAVAFGLERHSVRRLGGITGDVLGALCEVAATAALVVATMGPHT
jgi:adenosylcobinamide-GDP ribazoletransferase